MSVFDQRGQNVTYQYNAAGNINFQAVTNQNEVIEHLIRLKGEVSTAMNSSDCPEDIAVDVEYQVTKAAQQAKKTEPDKKSIIEHLTNAKGLIAGIASLAGLVKGVSEAIEAVKSFIP